MFLPRFNVIAAVDAAGGLGKDGSIPWLSSMQGEKVTPDLVTSDLRRFRRLTTGDGNNALIMGRRTFQSLPRLLPDRRHIVVSSQSLTDCEVVPSLQAALQLAANNTEVWIIGGAQLYTEALRDYAYLCDRIVLTRIPGTYDCDTFFPLALLPSGPPPIDDTYRLTVRHGEQAYLDCLQQVLTQGETRPDRTGVGVRSCFGLRMEFDLRQGFPLVTTKRTFFRGIKEELLFFLRGSTDTSELEAVNVRIWEGNTRRAYLDAKGLSWEEGDMGPGYGHQWRHAGAPYAGCDREYGGVDQIQELVAGLMSDPFGRRHIVSAWDPSMIKQMALPPCHCLCQFYVGEGGYLDAMLHQRSADMFLGVPFNIASYALLMIIVGHLTGLRPRRFVHNLGDAHIYLNHVEQVKEQLSRTPLPLPQVTITGSPTQHRRIEEITADRIVLHNYRAWESIKAPMAV